nr:T9SS type A sorting domain-containing protein [Saprospiraceae bacterium]
MTTRSFVITAFLTATCLLFTCSLGGQIIQTESEFTHYEEEYFPLENATTLTSTTDAWGQRKWSFTLDSNIIFPGLEDRPFHFLVVATNGHIALWHFLNEEKIELGLYMIPILRSFVSPLKDYRNEDQGAILYYSEDNYIKVEYRNVAFALENILLSGRLLSRVNYTIEIDPDNDRIRYHFGPSDINTSTQYHFLESGTVLGLGFEVWENFGSTQQSNFQRVENYWKYLEGSPDDFKTLAYRDINKPLPDSSYFDFPPEGTVYEFRLSSLPTSVRESPSELSIELSPNPGVDQFHLQINSRDWRGGELSVFNTHGQLVLTQSAAASNVINTAKWPSGLYFIHLDCPGNSEVLKWVKN